MGQLLSELKNIIEGRSGELKEHKGKYTFEILVAERKAFLTSKKLKYLSNFRIDEVKKELSYSEMLKETGIGFSSGVVDNSPGYGFKTTVYKSGFNGRNETIKEQSDLFGKQYTYKVEFGSIRKEFERKAQELGYVFKYSLTLI